MSFMAFIGFLFLFIGVLNITTYIRRRRWPVVTGTLDDVDVKIEFTPPTEIGGFFVRPKFKQKIRYIYLGNLYVTEINDYKMKEASPKLRINPEQPIEAYLEDNKSLLIAVLCTSIGLIMTLISINVGFKGTE